MTHYRSVLFVPGNRPDRFDKACSSGADLVCIDLEDAVSGADKDAAREAAIGWLKQTENKNVGLRINSASKDKPSYHDMDIKALATSGLSGLPFVMLPKARSFKQVDSVIGKISKVASALFPIIESAAGLVNCEAILSHSKVKYTLYGAIDLAADTGMDQSWESHLYGRSRVSMASAAYHVQLFDVPCLEIKDLSVCEDEVRRAKSLGIFAKSAIHPAQIAAIHQGLAPSDSELKAARRIVEAYEASDGNVAQLDGKMLELPIVKSAMRVIALADV